MALDILHERGTSIDRQVFTWRDRVQSAHPAPPDDPSTRLRAILLAGVEASGHGFFRACAEANPALRAPLEQLRRVEERQQRLLVWLDPPDRTPVERSLDFGQLAIAVTASLALAEPDPGVARALRSGLVEDFDHLARYATLLRRVEGREIGALTRAHLDLLPGGRGRGPRRDVAPAQPPYDRRRAATATKLNVLTLVAGVEHAHEYFAAIGPMFSERGARQMHADISAVERRQVAQYAALADPAETWLERWLLHEAGEAYNYWSCAETETCPRTRRIWERFLDYELGHVRFVADLFQELEGRDPAEVLSGPVPEPVRYQEHGDFIREVLSGAHPIDRLAGLRAAG
ncbi:MAG TPA: hypothetical protein VFQ51_07885 [Vicinamibacteria bacterium]|nr:hypothetical protein [Vicinamibacteria bacterium]